MGIIIPTVNLRVVKATNIVSKRANNLRRWTSFQTSGEYDELAKLGLNNVSVYMLASYAENEGWQIDWTVFPKCAIYRAYQKVYVFYDTPEGIFEELCVTGEVNREDFEVVTKEIIAEKANQDFADFICEGVGTREERIYKAATKVATLVELRANKLLMEPEVYNEKLKEIQGSLTQYEDIPGLSAMVDVNGSIFKVLSKIATLRNQNRWAAETYLVECSVLGHLFETGVYAYFMALELDPKDEETAAQRFFMGIFHDCPEAWTTDIPSPVKNRVKNLRRLTEALEMKMLEKHLFSQMPAFLAEKIKYVMMEDESNADIKPLMKGADYLSGDAECYRQYVAGSNDWYFRDAMRRNQVLISEGKIRVTPVCFLFDRYLMDTVEKLTKHIPDED